MSEVIALSRRALLTRATQLTLTARRRCLTGR